MRRNQRMSPAPSPTRQVEFPEHLQTYEQNQKYITVTDEACFCHLPTEIHVQKTPGKDSVILTCNTSCPEADPHTAFRWYWDRDVYSHCENQDIMVFGPSSRLPSRCAVKGHEDLHSDEVCEYKDHQSYMSAVCVLESPT